MIRDLFNFRDEPLLACMTSGLLFIILLVVFIITDIALSSPIRYSGSIVGIYFDAGETTVTNGVVVTQNGAVPIFGVTTSSDEWIAIVTKNNDSTVIKVRCRPEHYYNHKVGDELSFDTCYGYFTGTEWCSHSVK